MLNHLMYCHRHVYLGVKQRQVDRFLAGAKRCREVQREQLFTKLRRNIDSDFGRRHGFSEIRTVEDFRRHVPVAGYEYYRPFVEQVKQGKIRAMFGSGSEVLMFSMTSGTTSEPKYIPITNHFFKEYRQSWNTWGLAAFRDHQDLLGKHTLQFTSDWQQFRTEGGIPCGNISGLAVEMRPWISNPMFVLPGVLHKISGMPNKQYVALRLSLPSRKVGMITTANPLTLLNLARLADQQRESLIRDLYDGTLADHVTVPEIVLQTLQRQFGRRHPQRARELERMVDRTGHLWPRDFWPQLTVLAVWTGGPVAIYLPTVRQYYGNVVFRDHGLSASEGRMTTPFRDETSTGVLDYATHYFEFIPEEEHDQQHPTVLEAHELDVDKNYYILLTTSNGLYRYDIHDVVRCVGFEGTCPLLDFLHKGARFSSMVGEKLSELQVVRAVQSALEDVGLATQHFTLAPVPGESAHYVLMIEADIDDQATNRLAQRVDLRLSEMNCEYEDRIASRRLAPVRIQQVPEGTWDRLREKRISSVGASAEQYKHPFLLGQTDSIDELLKPVRRRKQDDTGDTKPLIGAEPVNELQWERVS